MSDEQRQEHLGEVLQTMSGEQFQEFWRGANRDLFVARLTALQALSPDEAMEELQAQSKEVLVWFAFSAVGLSSLRA